MSYKNKIKLSDEQELFVKEALEGKNILVDACIGSGKTTSIQILCDRFVNKTILYLTYNKLLKVDAKKKIINKNVTVQNYHGFAYTILRSIGESVGQSDLIQEFLRNFYLGKIRITPYDVLIIDEYQDIDTEISELLEVVKLFNPYIQIIAVGDMKQKIYNKTKLEIKDFIKQFLGDYIDLEFTKCFRLSNELASKLGRIWNKKITGINENCNVEYMNCSEVINFLSKQNPEDILCLGKNIGIRDNVILNELEERYKKKFNKYTVYARIRENDSSGVFSKDMIKLSKAAIFTTYDSSKGLERKICVICDFIEDYWNHRLSQQNACYEILRNIFCVAASRGKERIIFVKHPKETMLSEKSLSTSKNKKDETYIFDMSDMFDFKFKEDIEECFKLLKIDKIKIKEEEEDTSVISINNNDVFIDLSPCIGIYQEAMFFINYDIDENIKDKLLYQEMKKNRDDFIDETMLQTLMDKVNNSYEKTQNLSLNKKILYLTSLDTDQKRYISQVKIPFISKRKEKLIRNRLKKIFNRSEEVQTECELKFSNQKRDGKTSIIRGRTDVIKNNVVYELKFVEELTHEHFLQCACYMVALHLKKGILWNTRDNTRYTIKIPHKTRFLDAVIRTITKGNIDKYYRVHSDNKNNNSHDNDNNNSRKRKYDMEEEEPIPYILYDDNDDVKQNSVIVIDEEDDNKRRRKEKFQYDGDYIVID